MKAYLILSILLATIPFFPSSILARELAADQGTKPVTAPTVNPRPVVCDPKKGNKYNCNIPPKSGSKPGTGAPDPNRNSPPKSGSKPGTGAPDPNRDIPPKSGSKPGTGPTVEPKRPIVCAPKKGSTYKCDDPKSGSKPCRGSGTVYGRECPPSGP